MADASSLSNNMRLSLGLVQIGETGVVATGSQRREVQLSMDDRSVLLTRWGLEVVAGDMYIVRNIVPSNDFNKQSCYASTPLTKFEAKPEKSRATVLAVGQPPVVQPAVPDGRLLILRPVRLMKPRTRQLIRQSVNHECHQLQFRAPLPYGSVPTATPLPKAPEVPFN
uniref:Uncharacterized protein n=1 Tax=Magallana gigas TaxID=29159 RepID=A0A8W8MJ31_MAGGI